jgi:Putative auto-transporter adhesin, head GIN domain
MKKPGNIVLQLLLISAFLINVSCEDIWNRCVDGNGDRGIENRTLEEFERIEINGDFEVQIDTGLVSSASVETDENLIDLIVTHVSGNKLIIETRDGVCIRPSHRVEITVSTRKLREITLNGSGLAYSYGINTENLSLNLSGSGLIECDNVETTTANFELEGSGLINCYLITENLSTQLEGSGKIILHGECISADHKIIGSGNIEAGEVSAEVCVIYISGSGTVDADVNEALDVTIIGSGKVYYTGTPAIESYISGSGEIIER